MGVAILAQAFGPLASFRALGDEGVAGVGVSVFICGALGRRDPTAADADGLLVQRTLRSEVDLTAGDVGFVAAAFHLLYDDRVQCQRPEFHALTRFVRTSDVTRYVTFYFPIRIFR